MKFKFKNLVLIISVFSALTLNSQSVYDAINNSVSKKVNENWTTSSIGQCFKQGSLGWSGGSEKDYSVSFSSFSIDDATEQGGKVYIKGTFIISRTRKVLQGIRGYEWYTDSFTAAYSGECKKVFDSVTIIKLYISKLYDGESYTKDGEDCTGNIVNN